MEDKKNAENFLSKNGIIAKKIFLLFLNNFPRKCIKNQINFYKPFLILEKTC